MLKHYTETDFALLKQIAADRLKPTAISAGLMGMLIFSGAMTAVTYFAFNYSIYITNPIWPQISAVSIGFLIIQLIVTLFYFNEKRAFQYQRIQPVFLCIISLKMSVEMYQVYFLLCEDRHAPEYMIYLGAFCLLGGVLFFVISIIRAFRRVEKGEFQKGGKGMFNFKQSKAYVSFPIIYGATMMGMVIPRVLSDMDSMFADMLEMFTGLIICVVIQYGLALAWPEFLLLARCKRKFKSFHVKMPKPLKF